MKPPTLLRIASILTFVHAVLHTLGGTFGTASPGPAQVAVMAMKTNQFPVMGVTRTYWDFYFGLNLAVSIMLLVESVVFWQLGTLARAEASRLRPLMLTFLLGYACLAAATSTHFFAAPAIVEVFIALCLGWAMLQSRPAQ